MRQSSSGTTATTTSGDTAVTVTITLDQCRVIQVVADVAGFVSWDNGTVYHPFSAGRNVFAFAGPFTPPGIKIQRIPTGSNVSAYVSTWE